MATKRKPVKPRARKTVQKVMTQVHVVPKGLMSWALQVDGEQVTTTRRQQDAESLAVFLAKLMVSASVKFHDRRGRITEERTYPSSADPRSTPG